MNQIKFITGHVTMDWRLAQLGSEAWDSGAPLSTYHPTPGDPIDEDGRSYFLVNFPSPSGGES